MAESRTPVGSTIPSNYSVEDELAELRHKLANVADVDAMTKTAGWRKIRSVLYDRIEAIEEIIHLLAHDPETNKTALITQSAVRDAYKGLIDVVETTLKAAVPLATRYQKIQALVQKFTPFIG